MHVSFDKQSNLTGILKYSRIILIFIAWKYEYEGGGSSECSITGIYEKDGQIGQRCDSFCGAVAQLWL